MFSHMLGGTVMDSLQFTSLEVVHSGFQGMFHIIILLYKIILFSAPAFLTDAMMNLLVFSGILSSVSICAMLLVPLAATQHNDRSIPNA